MNCTDMPNPIFIIFSDSVPNLLYYSHLTALIVSLVLGLFIFIHNRKLLTSRILFYISLLFSFWVILNLVVWTNNSSIVIMIAWSMFGLISSLISVLSFLFLYTFIKKTDTVPFSLKIISLLLLAPIVIFLSTKFNLSDFNLLDCGPTENILYTNYYYFIGYLSLFGVAYLSVRNLVKLNTISEKRQLALMGFGMFLFLLLFTSAGLIASLIYGSNSTYDLIAFNIEQYGLFGMTIFMAFLAYLIVRFKAFDIKLIATQALVVGLVILIGSQFFFIRNNINRILTALTLAIAGGMGIAIVRSVKREVALREELEVANSNQQSLIHFISHQLKGFFTKSKMIFAGIIEEDFGGTSPTLKEVAREGLKSDDNAVLMIQDILGATNLRKGTMAYDWKKVDLTVLLKKTLDSFKNEIDAKGLELQTNFSDDSLVVDADEKQIMQVLRNLIDNSIKYTPSGTLNVSLLKENLAGKQRVVFKIVDSGVGLSESDKTKLFTEGGRGDDSVKINVNSTGYGLYIVKKIVETHGGRIWAESEGRGKGSTFIVELDIAK